MRPLLLMALAPALLAQGELFESRIRPVLAARCQGCHSAAKKTSGLAVDSKAGLERGGSRGTAVRPGDAMGSLLYRAVSYTDAMLKMPPDGKLPANVIEDIKRWIDSGAEDPRVETAPAVQSSIDWAKAKQYWAFQPLRPGGGSIDSLLRERWTRSGLKPSGPADKRTLLRRVTFDLTGLPPTAAEIEAFLGDSSANAYTKVVERLLASPHYGERSARLWLDLVRFAETNGHEFDFYKYEAWRYRDYVIRAFNEDLPYNTFVREHVGANAPSRPSRDGSYVESAIASGFYGLGEERNGATDLEEVRTEMRDSKIDVFGKAFLGLTVACARCHDHKFDPIPTTDYYALGGVFDSTRTSLGSIASAPVTKAIEDSLRAIERPMPAAPATSLRKGDERFDMSLFYRTGAGFAETRNGWLDSSRGASNALTGIMVSRSFVPKKKYIHVRVAGTKFAPVREEPSLLAVTIFAPGRYPKGVAGAGDRTLRWRTITLHEEINQVCHLEIADRQRDGHIVVGDIIFSDDKTPPPDVAESLPELAGANATLPVEAFGRVTYEDVPHNMRVHERGNHLNLGEEVPRGFLRVLSAKGRFDADSGRDGLAASLTESPLLARVMVNRLWKQHFGEGIVRTVDNFGQMGERPTHPELLDYLANKFVDGGWSLKAMHREMVLSDAYRRDSAASPEAAAKDPQNRLLTHMPVRRLEAEAVRDSILAVTGSLDRKTHGPSVKVHISEFQDGRGKPVSGALDGEGRRSVYLEVRRNFITPLLLAFDYPLPTSTAGRRLVSTVPAQALTMMNNQFVAEQAAKWAARVSTAFHTPRAQLDVMFEEAFARPPTAQERDRAATFFASGGTLQEFAHVLLNTKEFLFVR
ncbi:MAG: DUF1553 domain-containing protein [Acidobacteria bacterium]|nr:DUF1553 domain-containing protein [Acidobacteriota bacterium]